MISLNVRARLRSCITTISPNVPLCSGIFWDKQLRMLKSKDVLDPMEKKLSLVAGGWVAYFGISGTGFLHLFYHHIGQLKHGNHKSCHRAVLGAPSLSRSSLFVLSALGNCTPCTVITIYRQTIDCMEYSSFRKYAALDSSSCHGVLSNHLLYLHFRSKQ